MSRAWLNVEHQLDDVQDFDDPAFVFHASLDPDAVAQAIVDQVFCMVSVDAVSLYGCSSDHGEIETLAVVPEAGTDFGAHLLTAHHPMLHTALDQTQPESLTVYDQTGQERSVWIVPLHTPHEPVGLLALWECGPDSLTERERHNLVALSGQAALALRNALTHAQTEAMLRERMIELSTHEVVSRHIAATLERDIIASDVLAAAMSAIDAEVGTCLLVNSSGEFEVVARFDTPETRQPLIGQIDPPNQVIAQVLHTEQAVLITTAQQHDPGPGDGLTPGTRSILCVPLLGQDRAIGVFLFEDTTANAFSESHLRFVTTLAEHAAVAIANARLYQAVCAGRDQLQAILDSTRDAVLLFDHHGRLLRFNPVAEVMLDQPLAPYLGQSFVSWLRCIGAKRLQELSGFSLLQFRHYVLDVVRHPTRVTQRQFRQVCGDDIRYIDETGSPVLDQAGRSVGWLVVWRDRTEEHKLETMRRELSSMVVHDLRNPITSIISGMGVLQDLLADGEADRTMLNEVIQIAQTSADNMLNLVQSLLDVSRLEQSRIMLDCTSLSLADAIDNAIKSVLALALSATIRVENRAPTDLPAVWIDDEKIQRVLVNLLDNALRHTPYGGAIAIDVYHQTGEGVALIRVEDTGPGIAPEARSRIFDKFVQLDQAVLRGHKGTGLGLTFCKLVIEAHGGHIWVEDGAMGGAAFCFTVPVVSAHSG